MAANGLLNVKSITSSFKAIFARSKPSSDTSIIQRVAVDPSGYLGSLYDARRDSVLGRLDMNIKSKTEKKKTLLSCIVEKGDLIKQNLLKMFAFDEELRLNIALDIVAPTGIGSLAHYPFLIDSSIRFLRFSYRSRIESFSDDMRKTEEHLIPSISDNSATHIITEVKWGIEVIAVLQLPPDNENGTNEIDAALEHLRDQLISEKNTLHITSVEEHLFERCLSTKIYSNIPDLSRMEKICDACREIHRMKQNPDEHRQLIFSMRPIRSVYPQSDASRAIYVPIDSKYSSEVELYISQLSFKVKTLKETLDQEVSQIPREHLREQRKDAKRRFSQLKKLHSAEMKQFQDLVLEIRSGQTPQEMLVQLFEKDQKPLQTSIDDIEYCLTNLKEKRILINNLQNRHINYLNVLERGIQKDDDETTVQQKLLLDDAYVRIFCCDDRLKDSDQNRWDQLLSRLQKTWKKDPNLHLIYADFSYCSLELQTMEILPLKKETDESTILTTLEPTEPSLVTDDTINVLLLGESGVGKSTFINALANYLAFKTLNEARSGQPIVLIPISFLMTVNDDFQERIVKFGNADSNEDHDHPGQSVTQQCKSYVFNIDNDIKLQIIDTPGFSDTRGIDQDELNMQRVLSFINKLTHLNAVCVLLKPNVNKLHPFFKSCLTQIFDVLSATARENAVFCFTNTRATFFAPGDTSPLLKNLLKSLPGKEIPFEKENTFCFDSESFRYLVAVQNSIPFDHNQKREFKQCWSTSVRESNRLLEYIRTKPKQYRVHNRWRSIKEAQDEIHQMVRPMLEAMRNMLRNILLCNTELPNGSIELRPKAVHRLTFICYGCDRIPQKCGNFWIMSDRLVESRDDCTKCQCSPSEHVPTDYTLDYQFLDNQEIGSANGLTDILSGICKACAKFAHFLMETSDATQNIPFLSGIDRMIAEEQAIYKKDTSADLNKKLRKELKKLKEDYSQHMNTINSNQKSLSMEIIYAGIESVNAMPMIYEQINAGRQRNDVTDTTKI